jgi:hypothetical protein
VPTIRNATYEARAHSYLLKKGRPEWAPSGTNEYHHIQLFPTTVQLHDFRNQFICL